MHQPRVFIGSSVEGIAFAEALQRLLTRDSLPITWMNVFGEEPGQANLERLSQMREEFDFAVIIFTPDDIITSRETDAPGPRDNLVFELGLFIGAMDEKRAMFLAPESPKLKLPSDLDGIIHPIYHIPQGVGRHLPLSTANGVMAPAASVIKERIRTLGPRKQIPRLMFNPVIRLRDGELGFKVGYPGSGVLHDVSFRLYLVRHVSSPEGLMRTWQELTLEKSFAPELRYTWTNTHQLELNELPVETHDLESLQSLEGVFYFTVKGSTQDGRTIRGRQIYKAGMIRRGRYLSVVEWDPKDFDSWTEPNWDRFLAFEKADG